MRGDHGGYSRWTRHPELTLCLDLKAAMESDLREDINTIQPADATMSNASLWPYDVRPDKRDIGGR
jgi:hypothetical protein